MDLENRWRLYDQILSETIAVYDLGDREQRDVVEGIVHETIEVGIWFKAQNIEVYLNIVTFYQCHLILDSLEKNILKNDVYEQLILAGLIRPFTTSHLTMDGSARVTWENLATKYPNSEAFISKFRVRPSDIRTMIQALKLPSTYRCKSYKTTDLEVRRLSPAH